MSEVSSLGWGTREQGIPGDPNLEGNLATARDLNTVIESQGDTWPQSGSFEHLSSHKFCAKHTMIIKK